MRILRVADVDSKPGGMSLVMTLGGRALEEQGHSVEYIFRKDIGDWPKGAMRRLVCPWRVIYHVLRRDIRGIVYDVVEIHEPLAAPYVMFSRLLHLPPCVVLSHGLEDRHWRAQIERWSRMGLGIPLKSRVTVPLFLLSQCTTALRMAKQIIVPTQDDLDHLVNQEGLSASRITRVDNGAPAELRNSVRIDAPDKLRLLFFGSWIDRKGSAVVVDLLNRLGNTQIDWIFTLAGTGDIGGMVKHLPKSSIERLVLRPSIGREELSSLFSRQDILIAPAWFEGMPLSVLEAAAAGLAIIASDISGHRQIFGANPQDNGALLVKGWEASDFLEALARLDSNRAWLSQLQKKARLRAAEFTWESVARQLESAYYRTAQGNRN